MLVTQLSKPAARSADGGHQDALDGLRAIAILLVIFLHVGDETAQTSSNALPWRIIESGGVGVSVFFALSGLLLYRPWARAVLGGGGNRGGLPGPDTRVYLWRRVLRIVPAYWVMLIVGLFVFNPGHVGSVRTWFEMLTLTQNYDPAPWWKGVGPDGLGPMWSLSAEASFYLVLPLIAAGLRRFALRAGEDLDGRAKRLLYGLGTIALVTFACTVAMRLWADYDTMFYYEHLLPRWMIDFLAGMALTVLAEWARRRPRGPAARWVTTVGGMLGSCWLAAFCALVVVSTPVGLSPAAVLPDLPVPQNAAQYLVSAILYLVIAVALVAPVALSPSHPLTLAVLGNRVVRWLGLISYGLFLWHQLVIFGWYKVTGRPIWNHDFWLVLPVVLVVGIAISTVSFYVIEKPALRLRGLVKGASARRA
ncbi:MAG: acyltransferase-like protein [Actinomycetia bacterium]|nr:acyltransferase-like protein [Actinomycetes bacterium]